MSPRPTALLIDDGELDDVDRLLGELTDRHRLCGDERPDSWPWPHRLLVATPERVLAVPPSAPGVAFTTIVVAERDSILLPNLGKRSSFDYLVRRPVHPEALRLLLLRALFSGSEKRSSPRLPVGYRVSWIAGFRLGRATLLDISSQGCRLQTARPPSSGSEVTLHLPRGLVGGLGLVLRGQVNRVDLQDGDAADSGGFGVLFRALGERARCSLDELLSAMQGGPAVFREDSGSQASMDDTPNDAVATEADPAESVSRSSSASAPVHRLHRRASIRREIEALDERAERVLHLFTGRDLSAGGIRLEANPALTLGSELRLAIYADANCDPVVVEARVVGDYGEHGLGVSFEGLDSSRALQLQAIVESVPAVEVVRELGGVAEPAGVLVAEILSDLSTVSPASRIRAVKELAGAPRPEAGTLEADIVILAAEGCTVQHIFDVIRESPSQILRVLDSLLENERIRIED